MGTRKSTLTRVSVAKKRERSVGRLKREFEELGVTDLEVENPESHFNRAKSVSRARPAKKQKLSSDPHRSESGLRDKEQGEKLDKVKKKGDKKTFARFGKAGESDRRILEKRPKHLFAGKRGIGKNDRR